MNPIQMGLVTQFAMLRKAPHLTVEQFRSYWSDVHGPSVSVLPGIYEYVQHHFENDRGQWWPPIDGIERDLTTAAQFDGAPEVIFTSLAAREKWLTLALGIKDDEINVFSSMTHQLVQPGAATAYREAPDSLDDDHPLRSFKLLVFLKPQTDRRALADWLSDRLPELSQSPLLRKVRLSILDPVEMSAWQPEGISVDTVGGDDFAACLELECGDYLDARQLYATDTFAAFTAGMGEHVRALNAFRCSASYRFVSAGVLTLAGRFGATRARLIRDVGAVNHLLPTTAASRVGAPA